MASLEIVGQVHEHGVCPEEIAAGRIAVFAGIVVRFVLLARVVGHHLQLFKLLDWRAQESRDLGVDCRDHGVVLRPQKGAAGGAHVLGRLRAQDRGPAEALAARGVDHGVALLGLEKVGGERRVFEGRGDSAVPGRQRAGQRGRGRQEPGDRDADGHGL